MRATWLVVMCACGRYGLDTTIPAPGDAAADVASGCVAESNAAFCARLGKSCDSVSARDNCGAPRTIDCGTCSAPASACIANACVVPLCADTAGAYDFAASGTVVSSLHVANTQEALLGISGDAKSILFLRGNPCVTTSSTLLLGDDPTGMLSYTLHDLSGVTTLASFTQGEETMTLAADGLTIVGVATSGGLQRSTRSASGAIDFSSPDATPFVAVNAALPAGGALQWPLLSRDGLVLTFAIVNATTATDDGIYQAARSSTNDAFPAATKLAGDAQMFAGLSGISDDRMTAFAATPSYATVVLSRTSTARPFTTNAAATPPGLAWRVIPTTSCAFVVGTCEPGGCQNEDICTWTKQ